MAYVGFTSEVNNFYLFAFDFDLLEYTDPSRAISCTTGTNVVNIQYFKYIDEYFFICEDNSAFTFLKFKGKYNISQIKSSNGFNAKNIAQITFSECDDDLKNWFIIFNLWR